MPCGAWSGSFSISAAGGGVRRLSGGLGRRDLPMVPKRRLYFGSGVSFQHFPLFGLSVIGQEPQPSELLNPKLSSSVVSKLSSGDFMAISRVSSCFVAGMVVVLVDCSTGSRWIF